MVKWKWRDAITCARGKHFWGGWSMITNGEKTGAGWCLRCKVAWGEPISTPVRGRGKCNWVDGRCTSCGDIDW